MALYGFDIIDGGPSRHDGGGLVRTRVETEFPDREAARDFAIEMAEDVMAEQDGSDGRRRSVIAITDQVGAVLDTIYSESISVGSRADGSPMGIPVSSEHGDDRKAA